MRKMAIIAMVCVAQACFVVSACRADDTALQRLTALLDPIKSLQAQFVQTVSDADNVVLQTTQGTIAVARGNRLRWETKSPFAYLIVTDGNVMWRYDGDLEQATRQKFTGELADAPALILSGDVSRIKANYDVVREQRSAGEYFRLLPKQKNALFRALTLVFANKGISQLILQDNLDQHTDIRFNSLVSNPVLPASLFQFEPPKGVDVVDDEP